MFMRWGVGGGVPDAPRVSGKQAFTGSHRAGQMFMGWRVGEGFIPPGMLAAAETPRGVEDAAPYDWVAIPGMGNTARSRRPVGRPPYVPLFCGRLFNGWSQSLRHRL